MKDFAEFLENVNIDNMMTDTIDAIKSNDKSEAKSIVEASTITLNLLRQYHEWLNK